MNVVGTSTCIMAVARDTGCIPGVCGVVPGSVRPRPGGNRGGSLGRAAISSRRSRTRAGSRVRDLAAGLDAYRAGQTGLLRLTWDNGDRTVLVNPRLGGVTLGWNLQPHRCRRTVRGHRGHGVPHAGDSRAHGRARRADRAGDPRRRHSAEERGAEPGIRERAEQADARAGAADHESGFGALRVSGGGRVPVDRRGAARALSAVPRGEARSGAPAPRTSDCMPCGTTSTSRWARRARRRSRWATCCRRCAKSRPRKKHQEWKVLPDETDAPDTENGEQIVRASREVRILGRAESSLEPPRAVSDASAQSGASGQEPSFWMLAHPSYFFCP